MIFDVRRGQIYLADLNPVKGSEQGGIRPVVVVQNDMGNKYSTTIIVVPITGQKKINLPTHTKLYSMGLTKESTALMEQIRTIDKCRLIKYVGEASEEEMNDITEALRVSVDV